jgi:predicted site-specific integrase-resolvase
MRPALTSRGLTREQAAEFAGISPSTFDKYRREGKFPGPTLPGRRYDKRLMEAAMDRSSGIVAEGEAFNALDSWRASRARSNSRS